MGASTLFTAGDLTNPGSDFETLIWGVDSRFSADYVKGAWYVSTDYKSPNWGKDRRPTRASCPMRGPRSCPKGRI